jgi:hypothetical protein
MEERGERKKAACMAFMAEVSFSRESIGIDYYGSFY